MHIVAVALITALARIYVDCEWDITVSPAIYALTPPLAYGLHRQTLMPSLALGLTLWTSIFIASLLVPGDWRARPQGRLTACKSNLKSLATAMESRQSLGELPVCPGARKISYKIIWQADLYTLFCQGLHHRRTGITSPNYPQYTSGSGLILP